MDSTQNEQPAVGNREEALRMLDSICTTLDASGWEWEAWAIRLCVDNLTGGELGAAAAVHKLVLEEQARACSLQRVDGLRALRGRIAALKANIKKPMNVWRRARELAELARAERALAELEAQPIA
jgi:hypothetical protein